MGLADGLVRVTVISRSFRVTGFEPMASCSQNRCATGLRYTLLTMCFVSVLRQAMCEPLRSKLDAHESKSRGMDGKPIACRLKCSSTCHHAADEHEWVFRPPINLGASKALREHKRCVFRIWRGCALCRWRCSRRGHQSQ